MKITIALMFGAAALLGAPGCGGGNKSTTPTTPAAGSAETAPAAAATATPAAMDYAAMSNDQLCDQVLGMLESMATAIDSNKDNCDAMGAGLEKWSADHKGLMDYVKSVEGDSAKNKALEEACKPKMEATMQKVMPAFAGAGACQDNERVTKALGSMNG